jgi:hypothetical protein
MEYGLISQQAGSIQTINTVPVIATNGPSPNLAFYELDIGIGRSRFCQTDDCMRTNIALFAVTTTLIRGGRSAIERRPTVEKQHAAFREHKAAELR